MMTAALVIAFVVAQAAATLAPSPSPVDLRWDAPAGCPRADTVRAGIARGVPSAPGSVARVRATVVVTAVDADHWRAAVDLQGADWTAARTLKGPSCAAVADAAGLVIVLALATELQEREVVVEAQPPPPPPPPPPAPVGSSPVVALGAIADAGTLPSATAGLSLGLGWRWTRAHVGLRGALFSSRSATLAAQPDTGASVSLLAASLRACFLLGDALFAGPCVEGGVERLAGSGFGPITATTDTNLAPFGGGGLLAGWRLSRWVAPFFSADAAIPLVRARFSIEHLGQVHQPATVSFRGAAGLELRFR